MVEIMEIVAVELASDVKGLIQWNPDVQISKELKQKLSEFQDDDLIKVKKEIGSLKITHVEKVTEELLEREL